MACVIVLVAMAMASAWPYLSRNLIPLDLSHAYTLEPWSGAGEATGDVISRTHLYRSYGSWLQIAQADGLTSVLWNASDGLGAPLLALWQTRALSLFSLPVYLLGLYPGLGLSMVLKLLVAGLTAYYTARKFGFHAPLGLAVASMYVLSGAVWGWASEPLGDALPWLPLLLLTGERLALGLTSGWLTGALALALIALGGHPPALTGAGVFLAAYVSLRSTAQPTSVALKRWLMVLLALALGLGIAAVQLFPYYEYLGQITPDTLAVQELGVAAWTGLFNGGQGQPANLLLFPGFVAPLLLPLWWVLRRYMEPPLRARTAVLLATAIVGLVLGAVLGGSLQGAAFAPWLDITVFVIPAALALAFVVGAVSEEWIHLGADEIREILPRLRFAVPVVWLPYLGVVLWLGGGVDAWPVLVVAAILLVLFALTLFRPSLNVMAAGLIVVSAITVLAYPERPRSDAKEPIAKAPLAEQLQESGIQRIAGSGALGRWPLGIIEVQQCFSPNTAGLSRLAAYQTAAEAAPLLLRRTGAAGLLLAKEDIQGAMSDIRPVLKTKVVFEQGAILFEDSELAPRARVIYAGQRAASPGATPVNADDLPLIEGAMLPEDGPREAGTATITFESPGEVRVSLPDGPPGILVLADQWYPGWKAELDGARTPVIPVDGIFRGVEVGAGPHEVVFRFRPDSLRYGMIVSALGVIILLAGYWRAYTA